MGGASLQGVRIVKSRIAMYAGYFVAMLLLAAYLTGVLQQGILPRFRHQEAAPQHDKQSAISDQQSASQGSDQAPTTEPTLEAPTPSRPPEEKPSVQPASQKPAASLSKPSEQTSVLTGPTAPPTSIGLQKSAEADRQEKLLAEKRAELFRLEEQILKRKEESKIEEKWLAELKASAGKITKERDARREAGIKKLAKLYEGMEPEAAASILSKLEKNMAAEVLTSMKDRQASRVLAAMNGQKARDLSERLQEARADQTVAQEKAEQATP